MNNTVARLLDGIPLVESPLFEQLLPTMNLNAEEERIARDLHRDGFAVIEFPDAQIQCRADRMIASLAASFHTNLIHASGVANANDLRVQDAWRTNDDVRAVAANADLTALLGKLYGRPAFAFQTLNFPVGTQQAAHSDTVHFSSLPERYMCGVWLALEDISAEAGPLLYYPGSHRWPLLSNTDLGRRGWRVPLQSAQEPFEPVWQALVQAKGVEPVTFTPRKGQALIWAANLLHGGSVRQDRCLTRWSQVTHYYFENCIYYTPAFSDPSVGLLDIRTVIDIATGEIVPNHFMGEPMNTVHHFKQKQAVSIFQRLRSSFLSPF